MYRPLFILLALSFVLIPMTASAQSKGKAAKGKHRVEMEITQNDQSLGVITLELDANKAPITVKNFLKYAKSGFYDGTIFHRVIPNFMIQGGGFTPEMNKKEKGLRPGIKNEWKNGLKNKKWTVSMARLGGKPNSATAQFFINAVDNAFLDQAQPDGAAYAVFGEVVGGQDVVEKIKAAPRINHPKYPAPGAVTPEKPIVIQKVTVIANKPNKRKPRKK